MCPFSELRARMLDLTRRALRCQKISDGEAGKHNKDAGT
jgi:hypothetical protein